MPHISRLAAIALAALAPAGAALAQESLHVRGEVTEISGDTVTMQTEGGETVEVTMQEDYSVLVYRPISIDDLETGDYLSIPAMPDEDGGRTAVSLNVFPEAMQGTAEGERSWDLTPDSLMINATVGTLAEQPENHMLTVTYNGQEQQIEVPQGTPITEFAPAPDRKLSVGDNAVLFAERDGEALTASRAGVTEGGSLPPI